MPQKFCQLTLLNQPELTAIVQSTSGQVMAVRKGTMIKSNYDWIPKDAIVKTADNGNILLHASPLGAVTSVELQLMPERQPLRQSQRTSPAGAATLLTCCAADPGGVPEHLLTCAFCHDLKRDWSWPFCSMHRRCCILHNKLW